MHVLLDLYGDLASQFYNYYKNNNDHAHVIVLFQNARFKEAEGI